MATQLERKTKTRSNIIKAAKQLFDNQGYDETSLDALMKAANIVKGTFYLHFDSKLEVLISIEREARRERTRKALENIEAGMPVLPILDSYLGSLASWFETHEKIAEAVVLLSLRNPKNCYKLDPEISGRDFINTALIAGQKQGVIRNDVNALALTVMVGGFITISILGWSHHPQRSGLLANNLKSSMQLFLEGAKPQEKYNDR